MQSNTTILLQNNNFYFYKNATSSNFTETEALFL
jgi:hypothetical protein